MTFEELHKNLEAYYGYRDAIFKTIYDSYAKIDNDSQDWEALFDIKEIESLQLDDLLERAEKLLEEFSKQSFNVKKIIEGLMLYAENKVSSGGHYNIVEAKAIVNALEVKSSNDYLPHGILKDFETRRRNIRNMETPPNRTSSTTTIEHGIDDVEEETNDRNTEANTEDFENEYFKFNSEFFRKQLKEAISLCGKVQANYALLEVALEDSGRVKKYGQHTIFLTALKDWNLLPLDYENTLKSVKVKYAKKNIWNDSNTKLLTALKNCFKD